MRPPVNPSSAGATVSRVVLVGLGACTASLAPAAEFDCVIEPRQLLEIRSPVEGLIDKVNADRGDLVRKGQVMAEIDSSVERAAADIAKQRSEMEGAVKSGESRVEFTAKKAARAGAEQRQIRLHRAARPGRIGA